MNIQNSLRVTRAARLAADFADAATDNDFSPQSLSAEKDFFKKGLIANISEGKMTLTDAADEIAWFVHGDIIRRNGKSYYDHVWHVANPSEHHARAIQYKNEDEIQCAWMHDLFEETSDKANLKREARFRKSAWTPQDLRDVGFSERVIGGVVTLTKLEGEPYVDYIERVSKSWPVAAKLNDVTHNHSDSPRPDRSQLYTIAWPYLYQTITDPDTTPPGSSMAEFAARMGRYDPELFAQHSSRPALPATVGLPVLQPL